MGATAPTVSGGSEEQVCQGPGRACSEAGGFLGPRLGCSSPAQLHEIQEHQGFTTGRASQHHQHLLSESAQLPY